MARNLLAALILCCSIPALAGESRLILSGHAEHFQSGYNEKNWGLGYEYIKSPDLFYSVAVFLDSHDEWMGYVALSKKAASLGPVDISLSYTAIIGHTKAGTVPAILPYVKWRVNDTVHVNSVVIPGLEGKSPVVYTQLSVRF